MSTSQNKTMNFSTGSSAGSNQTQAATTLFWQAMDREVGTIHAERGVGENGADQWSMYGCAGDGASGLQGAFVAAFSGLVRGCTQERTREFLVNIETEAKQRGGKVYQNAMATLMVMTFQLRNCRGGKGEKDLSRWLFMELYTKFPKTVQALVPLFPKYGYWKDLNLFLQDCYGKREYLGLVDHIYQVQVEQLLDDNQTFLDHEADKAKAKANKADKPKLSLLAKYIPKEGRALDKKYKVTKRLAQLLFPEQFKTDFKTAMRSFRLLVTRLNRAIETTEVVMSAGRWDEVDFHLVASRCLNKNRRAFLNLKGGSKCKLQEARSADPARVQCRENLLAHMEKAKKGEVTLKGKQLFIHEIINKMLCGTSYKALQDDELTLLELQWKTHRDALQARLVELGVDADQVVTMCDVSGSMSGTPVEVALALSIMMSELAGEQYGNRFLSFSESPKWIEFGKDWRLSKKVQHAVVSNWGMTTDFLAAHDLILGVALKHKLKPDQLPKAFFVFSDMQFNVAASSAGNNSYQHLSRYADAKILASLRGTPTSSWGYNSSYSEKTQDFQTHHQILQETYRRVGLEACGEAYELPQTVYWNLRGDTMGFPVQADTPNTQMLSGFSADMITLVLENRIQDYVEKPLPTPWDLFVKAMDDEQYDEVHRVIAETGEGLFRGYQAPVRLTEDTTVTETATTTETSDAETDTDMPEIVVVGKHAKVHPAPEEHPSHSTKSRYTREQVADWFRQTLQWVEVAVKVLDENVTGASMEIIVAEKDRDSLVELGVTSRLRQNRVFTEWMW